MCNFELKKKNKQNWTCFPPLLPFCVSQDMSGHVLLLEGLSSVLESYYTLSDVYVVTLGWASPSHVPLCPSYVTRNCFAAIIHISFLQNERLNVSKQKVSAKCFYSADDKLIFFCHSTVKFHFYLQKKKKKKKARMRVTQLCRTEYC